MRPSRRSWVGSVASAQERCGRRTRADEERPRAPRPDAGSAERLEAGGLEDLAGVAHDEPGDAVARRAARSLPRDRPRTRPWRGPGPTTPPRPRPSPRRSRCGPAHPWSGRRGGRPAARSRVGPRRGPRRSTLRRRAAGAGRAIPARSGSSTSMSQPSGRGGSPATRTSAADADQHAARAASGSGRPTARSVANPRAMPPTSRLHPGGDLHRPVLLVELDAGATRARRRPPASAVGPVDAGTLGSKQPPVTRHAPTARVISP